MKQTTITPLSRVAPIARLKKSPLLAETHSIKDADIKTALGHFRNSFHDGDKYLELQKAKLTKANYKILHAATWREINVELKKTGALTSIKNSFQSFNAEMQKITAIDKVVVDASKGINLVFANFNAAWQTMFLRLDFEKFNIEVKAATALLGYLEKAVDDPDIKKSAALMSIARFMLDAVANSGIWDDDKNLLNRLTENALATAISNQTSTAAKNPRGKGKALTVNVVAAKLNENKNVKLEATIDGLCKEYGTSKRTVERRIAKAKKDGLVT
jgi:hypothetical protein